MDTPETEESKPKLNLYQKIVEVRKCVPFLQKDTQGYKYKYVAGVSILSAIHDKMNELGLLLMPSVSNRTYHTETVINSKGEESKQRIIEAEMILTWVDAESSEKIEVPWLLFGEQNDISKAFGSGLTYSERYYLLKALNIPTDEDDPDAKDEPKASQQKTPSAATGQISDKQRAYIIKIGKDNELTENETRGLVAFMAKKHGISNNHWQIAKLFIPETEFKKRLNESLDAIEKNESNQSS